MLTEYTSWRWCLLVNIPVAAVAVLAALPLVRESRAHGNTRYDIPGAVLVTARAGQPGLRLHQGEHRRLGRARSPGASSAAAVVLLALFVVVELRSANPLVPMRILLHRTRGGAYLSSLLTGAGFIGAMLFLTTTCSACSTSRRSRRVWARCR